MKNINIEQFLKYKESDTLIIWGSGSSAKNLKKDDFNFLNSFDSIGTTMFCKTKIQTTFYIIGEIFFNYYRAKNMNQKINGERLSKLYEISDESPNHYISLLKEYKDTCFIIWNDNYTLNKAHFKELNKLENDFLSFKQYGHESDLYKSKLKIDRNTGPDKFFIDKRLYNKKTLLEDKILLHQWKGITTPIYFAKCMGYTRIIFAGVDLTAGLNSYAFDRNSYIKNIINYYHSESIEKGVHPCKDILFKFINYLKNDIEFATYTPSLLEEIIPLVKPL